MQVNQGYAIAVKTSASASTPQMGKTWPVRQTQSEGQRDCLGDLAMAINPASMSRNEAMEIANMLMISGEAGLSSVFS